MGAKLGKCKKSVSRKLKRSSTHTTPQLMEELDENGAIMEESQASTTFISIDELPRELIWMIIEYAPESVLQLRMASQYLKSCIDEYSILPTSIQLIEMMHIHGTTTKIGTDSDCMTLSMYTIDNKASLFKLRIILGNRPKELLKRFHRERRCDTKKVYILTFDHVNDTKHLLEYMAFCIGRRIEYASMMNCDDVVKLAAVDVILNGKQFEDLTVSAACLSTVAEDHLIRTLKTGNVDRLELEVDRIESDAPKELLIQLSSMVKWLRIDYFDRARGGLAKISNTELPPIILEMFAKKLDGLEIRTDHYLDFHTAKSLVEEFSRFSEKRFWFSVKTKYFIGFPSFKEYDVQFEQTSIGCYSRLNVRHLSRIGDNPF